MTHIPAARRALSRAVDPALEAAQARAVGLMEAMVAAYALMAHADGEVAAAERRRIFAILRDNPAMTVFSRDEIAEEIAAHEANYRLDPEVAQQLACEKLEPVKGDRRIAHRIVAACREIIPADGVAHPAEYRVLNQIKALLDYEPGVPSSAARSVSAAAISAGS